MGVDTLLDEQVKIPLIDDTIELVDPPWFDREKMYKILQRRLDKGWTNTNINKSRGSSSGSTIQSYISNSKSGIDQWDTNQQQLNLDFAAILGKEAYADVIKTPEDKIESRRLGNYQRIAPSPQWDHVLKLKGLLFSK